MHNTILYNTEISIPYPVIQQTNANGNERAENGTESSNPLLSLPRDVSASLHRSLFAHLQSIDFHRFSIIVLFGAEKKIWEIKLRLLRRRVQRR